jgi:hypothetical protein
LNAHLPAQDWLAYAVNSHKELHALLPVGDPVPAGKRASAWVLLSVNHAEAIARGELPRFTLCAVMSGLTSATMALTKADAVVVDLTAMTTQSDVAVSSPSGSVHDGDNRADWSERRRAAGSAF